MKDLIICVAPVPGEKQSERYAGELNTAEEIIESYKEGASICHLHVRDKALLQTVDTTIFERDIKRVKEACPIIVEGSTGGAPEHTLADRCVSFNVPGIELGSLNLGSVNMFDGVYNNRFDDMVFYARKLKENKIKPFMFVFDLSHFHYIKRLEEMDLISPPHIIGFVFDVPNQLPYSDKYLDLFLSELPDDSVWFLIKHHAMGATGFKKAYELGGHIRVGYEDGPFLSDGNRAGTNRLIVREIAEAARGFDRNVVSPERAREVLGLGR